MKILADTNILISALLYPKSVPSRALLHAAQKHELILSDYNIAELRRVVAEKFAKMQPDIDLLLSSVSFTLVPALPAPQKLIDDPNDAPILNAAIVAEVDIIISGDKHFLNLKLPYPKVMTAAEYLDTVRTDT
jgi:putative PIN family toxin of toxin-antitoxin system